MEEEVQSGERGRGRVGRGERKKIVCVEEVGCVTASVFSSQRQLVSLLLVRLGWLLTTILTSAARR